MQSHVLAPSRPHAGDPRGRRGLGIIRDEFPSERVGAGLGLLPATFGVGGGAGLVLLPGVILESLPWTGRFWIGAVPAGDRAGTGPSGGRPSGSGRS